MRRIQFYQIVRSILGVGTLVFFVQHNAFSQEECITQQTGDQIRDITENGYTYELWNQFSDSGQAQGTACMTPNLESTTFSARWDNTFNYLARRGLGFDGSPMTHSERGDITVEYTASYNPGCNSGESGISFLSVYGWSRDFAKEQANQPSDINNPPGFPEPYKEALVEYYIIENHCGWTPANQDGVVGLGNFSVDGSTYDAYLYNRVSQPSIRCNGSCDNFYQYFSIRRQTRSSGTINVTAHFDHWENERNVNMGGLHEVMMKVEGYDDSRSAGGSTSFSELEVTVSNNSPVTFGQEVYVIDQYDPDLEQFPPVATFVMHEGNSFPDISVESNNPSVLDVGGQLTYQFMVGACEGSADMTLYGPNGEFWDTAHVVVRGDACSNVANRVYQVAAQGRIGGEKINITLNNIPMASHVLTNQYAVYTGDFVGEGEVGVEFVNDDGLANGRDVRLDYIEVDGQRRETEAMTQNNAAYENGVCGGGAYTEWLHCDGSVNFGEFDSTHTIVIRARGNAGGEHIKLLVDGQAVKDWWLGTQYAEYSATVTGDGDINVAFDNDGGQRDVIIDWVKVDKQNPRQAENMDYNTGAWANGQCGGGTRTQWLHCNGVIGFGNVSDNFD